MSSRRPMSTKQDSIKRAIAVNRVAKQNGNGATDGGVLPLRRQTLASMTLDSLRDRILRGGFPEGEPLRQDAIAIELGVSRIPVREALRQLESEGLVTFNPHRGAVVSTLSLEEITELFELRAEIEGDLLRRAVPLMTTEDDARTRHILDGYEVALQDGEIARWGELNWEFHSSLYAPSNRPFTLAIVSKLHQHADRYLRMQLALTHGESRARAEHRAIAAATRKRDVRKAAQLMRDHILGAGKMLLTFLEQHRGERAAPQRVRGKAAL
jgi:DNA-binding GntR family transcriptional regulator